MARLRKLVLLALVLVGMYLLLTALPVFASGALLTGGDVARLLIGLVLIGIAAAYQSRADPSG